MQSFMHYLNKWPPEDASAQVSILVMLIAGVPSELPALLAGRQRRRRARLRRVLHLPRRDLRHRGGRTPEGLKRRDKSGFMVTRHENRKIGHTA